MNELRFLTVSKAKQALIRLCQRVNYGLILNIQVRAGDPCPETLADVVVDVRLDGDIRPRQELDLSDFDLPIETRRLLSQLDALKDGIVEKIIVQDGTPRRVVLRGIAAEAQS
jgi:hypothetical protein